MNRSNTGPGAADRRPTATPRIDVPPGRHRPRHRGPLREVGCRQHVHGLVAPGPRPGGLRHRPHGRAGPEDQIMWYHRGANWPVARGMRPEILADLLGRTNGSVKGKGAGAPHWVDHELGLIGSGGTLGTAFVIAGGLALAKQVLGQAGIAVAGFGDGTAARGTFHETLIQAAAWKLPLLYFCENNGWAVGTSFERTSPTRRRRACTRLRGPRRDGRRQDPVAVYAAVQARAPSTSRAGNGPRWSRPATSGSGVTTSATWATTGPRTSSTTTAIRSTSCAGYLDAEAREIIAAAAQAELEPRRAAALAGPIPTRDIIFKNIYAE